MRILSALLAASLFMAAAPQSPAPDHVEMIRVEGEGANYWPRWRGPSGQGIAQGANVLDTWSATENIKWRTKLDIAGNGSPIVWGGHLFLVTSSWDGSRRGIAAFDRAGGRKLWETFAPVTASEEVWEKNGYASSTPSTDGTRVYAYLGSHGVMAVDFAGAQVWHQRLGSIEASHGTAGSPLLYKDRLILYQDQRGAEGGFIAAFDAKTGERRWMTPRAEQVGWGTPVAIRAGTRDEIIVSSMRKVYAYDPGTGAVLWTAGGSLFEVIPTPVAGHGLVFASSGRAGPTLAIRPGGSGDVAATHVAWKEVKGSPFVPSPLLYGDELYLINDMASIVTAYDARQGTVLWQGRLGDAVREGFSASPVGVDGKVFFTNDAGDTFVLQAGKAFNLLRVNRLGEPVLASPALVDGVWYFRTHGHLLAIGK
ncbi:MAG: PQQ-binding-like beta-propeller repeat protein [Acidobacteriota bacterium]|nr:PQQ-binding-like beta-propeller repeat protein [Acidobacteriota bacterium]